MNGPLLPGWQVARLLIRLRLRRLFNRFGSLNRSRKKRSGTRAKRRSSVLLPGFVAVAMVLAYGNLAHLAVTTIDDLVGEPTGIGYPVFGPGLLHVLTVETALLCLAGILMALGTRELSQPDWDLEWLVTLPVETTPMLWARIAERTFANAFGLLALWPTCTLLAWHAGDRWSAPVAGLLAALPLLVLMAMARTLVDTGLRLRLAPSRLRNLQAAISVASILVLYLSISPAMAAGGRFLMPIARALPAWIDWTPPGLVLRTLGASEPAEAAMAAAWLIAEVAVILMAGMQALRALLAHGVVSNGARESGRSARRIALAPAAPRRAWMPGSPIQRRELMLLARDRNFMVQTLVLPVLIIGVQWALNGRIDSFARLWTNPPAVAAVVFGVASYALMLSAFQTLAAEGGALWLLFTFPRPIEQVLRDKAMLWGVLVMVYPAIGFGLLLAFGPPLSVSTIGLIGMVLLAVPIYSTIAVALGVFGCNPLATEPSERVKITYVYLYMLLSGLYAGAFFAPYWWQSLVSVVLAVLLALALWQKARDQLPYLLDPVAGPPARVSTADGLIAAMLFFVLQMIIGAIGVFAGATHRSVQGPAILVVFAIAGGLTYAGVRYVHWRTDATDVPHVFDDDWRRAVAVGGAIGICAAIFGIAYLQAANGLGALNAPLRSADRPGALQLGNWILPLGMLAAPLFEDFIFRGLIFGGLRRSMRFLPAAAASAAVFAIVHPPLAMIPVFALGLCAAWAYDRTDQLLAPMIVHAIYNAAVIGWQAYVIVPGR